jgi:hypothetical protein
MDLSVLDAFTSRVCQALASHSALQQIARAFLSVFL